MDPDRIDDDREAASTFMEMRPLFFDGTRRTVSLAAWLYDMEQIFLICHIEARLQVSLASRCLILDALLWWRTIGERALPDRTWAHFRAIVVARYGPLPDEGVDMPHRDPYIYRDMYHAQYLSYAAVWHAYPHETMSHYCRRFQEAMLPHIPQDVGSPEMHALQTLRDGLPAHIRIYVPAPLAGMTVEQMIGDILEAEMVAHIVQADAFVAEPQVPVDDAGMGEPFYGAGPLFPEDPIPAVPLQEIPPPEVEEDMAVDDFDPADLLAVPEDPPEDPPVIDIPDDDEEDEEPEEDHGEDVEPEFEHAGWLNEAEDQADDPEDWFDEPEEIPFDDADWDPDSDPSSGMTSEDLD